MLVRAARRTAQQAAVGFEPTNNGFAIRPLRPLGYAAGGWAAWRGRRVVSYRAYSATAREGQAGAPGAAARLLIRRPRRAVTLGETSNQREARVIGVARTVAEFLGVPVEESNRRRDRDGADGA